MTDLSMVDSGDEELDATTLGPNDDVMVKFASKKAIRHNVGMIVKPADEFACKFEVTFLKCSKKSVTAAGSQSLTRKASSMCRVMTLFRACLSHCDW